MNALSFLPIAASTEAARTDRIYFALIGLSAVIVGVVLSFLVVFVLRYRRGSKAKRGDLPAWTNRDLEIGWTSGALILALFLAWWTGATELSALIPPKDAIEIHIVAKQWMWKTQHENGVREINALHVPANEPVRLVMISEDVIHSFFVPEFRIKQDVLPGRYTRAWFNATTPGIYHLFCTQFCGSEHARMTGELVVMSRADYARWLADQPAEGDLAKEGEALFRSLGCSGCHDKASAVRAPKLAGLYGGPVELADGSHATADDAFIRDMILQPKAHAIAGYQPIMPSYSGLVGDDEMLRLTAYIRLLKDPAEGTSK